MYYDNANGKKISFHFDLFEGGFSDMKKLLVVLFFFIINIHDHIAYGEDLLVSRRRFPGNPGLKIQKLTCQAFQIIIILSDALSAICIQ